jgi:putative membrane protein
MNTSPSEPKVPEGAVDGAKSGGGVSPLHVILLVLVLALQVWSGISPVDRTTWALEVFPVVFALIALIATYRRFRFSNLAYVLIAVHATILIIGGHWTYAENPLFAWLQEALDLQRNHYDRLGHLAQGFIPAILAREVLLRTGAVRPGRWVVWLTLSICLAISATYELFEWWASLALGEEEGEFLATQGDIWDTQWDMFLCLVGAITALLTLSRLHDRSMKAIRAA